MHRVVFGEGDQTLYWAPVDLEGRPVRPGTVTYSLVDLRVAQSDATRVLGSGAASYAGGDTTSSAAAGPAQADPKLVAVSSATGFVVGRMAEILEAGQWERFELADIAGSNLYATRDLRADYSAGATVRGAEATATFPGTEADDELEVEDEGSRYQLSWLYDHGGRSYVVPQAVWLDRYSVVPFIDQRDILRVYPRMTQRAGDLITPAIAGATEDFVARLATANIDSRQYRGSILARVAVRAKALAYLFEWGRTADDLEVAGRFRDDFDRHCEQILTGHEDRETVHVSRADDTQAPPAYQDNILRKP